MMKKTELEHRMNKDNIDICCIQKTHLQKDKTCLVKQFAICLGVVVILLLNVMEVFSVGGGARIDRVWSSKECACGACDPSVHLSVPSIGISSFKSLRAGSQVFALLVLFLWVILHTMLPGKSMQLLGILPFGMLCLSAITMCLP